MNARTLRIAAVALVAIVGPDPGPAILVELVSLVFAAGPLAVALELGDTQSREVAGAA